MFNMKISIQMDHHRNYRTSNNYRGLEKKDKYFKFMIFTEIVKTISVFLILVLMVSICVIIFLDKNSILKNMNSIENDMKAIREAADVFKNFTIYIESNIKEHDIFNNVATILTNTNEFMEAVNGTELMSNIDTITKDINKITHKIPKT